MPAPSFVEVHTEEGVLAARSGKAGVIHRDQVLGWPAASRFCRDPRPGREHHVELLVTPFEGAWPSPVRELRWPYPPDEQVMAGNYWETLDGDELEQLELDEQERVDAIVDRLAPLLPASAVVADVACSHGLALAALHSARPDLQLVGFDRSERMVAATRAAVPTADVQLGDAREPPNLVFDVVICRALSFHVMTRADALVVLDEAVRHTRPGGWVVLHSWLPPLVGADDAVALSARVRQSLRLRPDGSLCPFYVFEIPDSGAGGGA